MSYFLVQCLLLFTYTTPTPPPVPKITWLTEQDHNFGDLKQGRPVEFAFQFSNSTPDTLHLQTVRTTCGCTAATWTETPIAPGATGAINIEYDAYQQGSFNKKIKVFFDTQRKPEILFIHGNVE